MPDYLTVRSHGVVTYCDGLIARIQEDQAEAYLLSLVGSPEHIQATSAHFTMGGASGRMQAGATVTWEFADFPGAFDVNVIEARPAERLVFDWPDHHGTGMNRVTFAFDEFAPGRTRVEVTESGWQPTRAGLQSAYGNVMGWTYMLAAMRVWLDHGIATRPGMFR